LMQRVQFIFLVGIAENCLGRKRDLGLVVHP
jgi:hypothetical protein